MSRKLVEAALFMSSRPMSAEEISKITGVAPGSAEKILDVLSREYASEGKGVEIVRVPEGWEMRVRPELLPKVAHLTPYSDLRDGHKRTLALVAYREPLKQSEIVRIQGNKAYNYIKFLRRKGLVKSEKEGRTVKLSLTKEFERYFGLEKSKVRDMLQKGMERAKARDAAREARDLAKSRQPVPPQPVLPAHEPSRPSPQAFQIRPGPAVPAPVPDPAKAAVPAPALAVPAAGDVPASPPKARTEPKPAPRFTPAPASKPASSPNPVKGMAPAARARKRSRKLPPSAKIGTRRPAGK